MGTAHWAAASGDLYLSTEMAESACRAIEEWQIDMNHFHGNAFFGCLTFDLSGLPKAGPLEGMVRHLPAAGDEGAHSEPPLLLGRDCLHKNLEREQALNPSSALRRHSIEHCLRRCSRRIER